MSDVLIKGMEMPDKATTIVVFPEGKARVFRQDIDHDEWLTAIEVPPHGRLIDADALKEQWLNAERTTGAEKVLNLPLECFISYGCVYDLDNAPTIIGVEDGE